jgi:hypothetical protein
MPPFDKYTQAKIKELISKAQHDDAPVNQLFYDGDHWQAAAAWIGPAPAPNETGGQEVLVKIARAFISKNAIKEVVNRHVGGVIGREPSWKLTPRRPMGKVPKEEAEPQEPAVAPPEQEAEPGDAQASQLPPKPDVPPIMVDEAPNTAEQALIDEAEAALTTWWDERGALDVLQDAAVYALLAERGVIRLYVPRGLLDTSGAIPTGTLEESLSRIYIHAPDPEQATVYTDPDTQEKAGLYTYEDDETGQDRAEIVALDANKQTVLRMFGETDLASPPLNLGGQITIAQVARDPLITPQIRQQQTLVNLALTMLGRNVEVGGFIARILFNAQLPGYFETVDGVERFVPDPIKWGAGVTNNFVGSEIRDAEGNVTGYATPSYVREEPVDPSTFLLTKDAAYRSILEEAQQLHSLIAGDATASGESRKQARADFEQSLSDTETQLNRVGRWLIETALAMAAAFAGTPGRFDTLRAVFECRIDAGPLSIEELRLNMELSGDQPLLSQETAMARSGVDDVDAELGKIAEEAEARAARAPQIVPVVVGKDAQPQNGKAPLFGRG